MTAAVEYCRVSALMLSTKPLRVMLRPSNGSLSVIVRFFAKGQHLSYSTRLTKLEADQFFASLADACGYETTRVSYRKDPLLLAWNEPHPSKSIILSGHVYSKRDRTMESKTVMFRLKITKKQALDLLETIAEYLGWELT
jgi:hypothetical protein